MNVPWAAQYIGLPWKLGGKDMKGFDCWGLFAYVQWKHFDTPVAFFGVKEYTARDLLAMFSSFESREELVDWKLLTTPPEDGDAVLLGKNKQPCHVGVVASSGIYNETKGVLHCVEKMGVMFSPFDKLPSMHWNVIATYRHKNAPSLLNIWQTGRAEKERQPKTCKPGGG